MTSSQKQQINFTIVPDDEAQAPRTYANFCAVAHTPFDVTLTFCEVMPLSAKDIEDAKSDQVVRAPVRAKIVLPMQFVPNLISTLQDQMRSLGDASGKPAAGPAKGPIH